MNNTAAEVYDVATGAIVPNPNAVTVDVAAPNGHGSRRAVTLTHGDKRHVDRIDPLSAFERGKLLDRASVAFGVPRQNLCNLDSAIVEEAERTEHDEAHDEAHATQPTITYRPVEPGTILHAADRDNYGEVIQDLGDSCLLRFISPAGKTADIALPKTQLTDHDGKLLAIALDPSCGGLPDIEDIYDLCQRDIPKPIELIQGILHAGSKLSLSGTSKGYKTFTLNNLGLSVGYGLPWMGHETTASKVLIVNLEIQEAFCQRRLKTLADARGITQEPGRVDIWNLRGYATSHLEIFPKIVERVGRGKYGLIIFDPIYKLYGDTDENSARDVAALLNSIESIAVQTGAAVAFGSHFSKGNQSAKSSIDRTSGSGVFARDPDSILSLTAHSQEDCYTLEATLRNFPPLDPFVVRWAYPLFVRDDGLNPADLKKPLAGNQENREAKQAARIDEAKKRIVQVAAKHQDGETATVIRDAAGLSDRDFKAALAALLDDGDLVPTEITKSNRKAPYQAYKLTTQE